MVKADALTKRLEQLAKKEVDKLKQEDFKDFTKDQLETHFSNKASLRESEMSSIGADENLSDKDYYKQLSHIQNAKQDHDMMSVSGHFYSSEIDDLRAKLAVQEQKLANLRASQAVRAPRKNNILGGVKGMYGMEANATEAAGTGARDPELEQQEELERQEDIRQQTEEERQRIKEEKDARIERLKKKRDKEIENVKKGPNFMWILWVFFVGLWFMDSIIGWIPFMGDVASAGISFIVWSALAILLVGDMTTIIKIIIFLAIDLFVGFIPGIGDIADIAVEPLALFIKQSPPQIFKRAYQFRIPRISQHIRAVYDKKIKLVEQDEDTKFKQFKATLQGHYTGLAVDNKKIIAIILFILVAFFGPMGFGWLVF